MNELDKPAKTAIMPVVQETPMPQVDFKALKETVQRQRTATADANVAQLRQDLDSDKVAFTAAGPTAVAALIDWLNS